MNRDAKGRAAPEPAPPSGIWSLRAVSVCGFSHQKTGTPCQDSYACASVWGPDPTAPSHGRLVAVVADGASTASRGAEGAAFIAGELAARLCGADVDLLFDPLPAVRRFFEAVVEEARRKLSAEAAGLSAYHATFVGCVADSAKVLFFHIGDGAGVALRPGQWRQGAVSAPENGEYANETYFFTAEDWKDHLSLRRVTGDLPLILLATDGVTPFAFAADDQGRLGLYPPFIAPLHAHLAAHDEREGQAALLELFQRDAIRAITGDDKTLLWAFRAPPGKADSPRGPS